MDRLTTGIAELDRVLGGGIVPGSLVVLAGAPGTGKTILAQQICFANATTESPSIYYTTQSESHQKMIHHLEGLSFFERGALGERVVFNNLASITPGGHDVIAVSDEVIRSAFDRHPSVIVIDSARALHTAANHDDFRRIIYDLASKVSHSEAILVFVGEYLPNEIGEAPEFAVADVIVTMSNETDMAGDRRWLRVLKVRGSDYMSGKHPFRIGSSGIELTPRAEAFPVGERPVLEGRLSTGIPGLDEMMGGGIPAGDVTLVAGPSGAGKTVMSLSFAADGIDRNEPVLYLTFQETERQLIARARSLGRDLEGRGGLLDVLHVNPVEVGLDQVAARVRTAIQRQAPKRVVIESIAELEHAAQETSRLPDFLWTLLSTLRAAGATTLITNETAAFFGPTFELARGLSFLMDNVILMRYAELESEVRRALGVIKMRESDHVKSLVEFTIDERGFRVIGKFAGVAGVLTGTPVRSEEKFREFFGR